MPDWRGDSSAICVRPGRDEFWMFQRDGAYKLPTPPQMNNRGDVIVPLGNMMDWLASKT